MTPDQERWAEALAIYRAHGAMAKMFASGRIADLAAAGDQAGVDRWLAIATRLDQLFEGPLQ